VLNGLPECLKIFTSKKMELLKDFNSVLENVVLKSSDNQSPLLVFTFSDSNERSNGFLNRIFSKNVMAQKDGAVKILNLNPPTEQQIDKILKQILEAESILHISDEKIKDIRVQSNKDLRNAIQTLQFYAAGKKVAQTVQMMQ
jgi:hypothetical protein